MQGIGNLVNKLTVLRNELHAETQHIAATMASNHKARVIKRLQEEGIPGAQYSERGIFPFLIEKSKYAKLNAGFDRLIKQKKKSKELISWKDIREANGLQTNYVDFTFTGSTFKNLNVIAIVYKSFYAVSTLGCTNAEEAFKLLMGYKMYGDFLAPNEEERQLLHILASKMVIDLFEKVKV